MPMRHGVPVPLLPLPFLQLTFVASSTSLNVVDKETGAIVSTPGSFSLSFTNGAGLTVPSGPIAVTGSQVTVTPFPY